MTLVCAALLPVAAIAQAPKVRISVVAAGGSGIEQDAADRISGQLEAQPDVILSTVNPDWTVSCKVQEVNDQYSGQIRYNGTVTIRTNDGQVVSTVSAQKYKQDFSMRRGEPLNKALVEGAARECAEEISARAVPPIEQAVLTEMDTRERVINASKLGDQGKYDQAIALLQRISPDSTHFRQVRALMTRYERAKGGHHGRSGH
jgi:hypothetical protein